MEAGVDHISFVSNPECISLYSLYNHHRHRHCHRLNLDPQKVTKYINSPYRLNLIFWKVGNANIGNEVWCGISIEHFKVNDPFLAVHNSSIGLIVRPLVRHH